MKQKKKKSKIKRIKKSLSAKNQAKNQIRDQLKGQNQIEFLAKTKLRNTFNKKAAKKKLMVQAKIMQN